MTWVLMCMSIHLWAATLTPEQQAAKVRGITLYNQYKNGEPDLRIAAEAGDREAQYYLGEDLRHTARYMTAEAQKWYTAAADQGDMYAMRRLASNSSDLCSAMDNCPKGQKNALDWLNMLVATAEPLVKQGNGEAMYLMYRATGESEWLKKSAEAGYPFGQYWLAIMYKQGDIFFFPPWKRSDRVAELYKQAAEGGYPPATLEYAGILRKEGNPEQGWYWIKKGAEAGDASIFSDYAYSFSDPDNRWGTPVNYVKSYGLMSLLLELNRGGGMLVFVEGELPRIATHLTPEQIEEAKKSPRSGKPPIRPYRSSPTNWAPENTMRGRNIVATWVLMCMSIHLWAATLTPEQKAAKVRGITLYNQYKNGEPDLRVAAEAGDREAQYYLGEDLRHTARYMTAEAQKWYTAAADQGDYYAMYQLSGKGSDLCAAMGNCPKDNKTAGEWLLLGRETAKALADKGDAEAMYVLHFLTNKDEWLEKSAASGYPRAQWFLAAMYKEGKGFFILPWKRSERVAELYKQSAEGGYPPAMFEYAGILRKSGDMATGRAWLKKGVDTGYAKMLGDYAYSFSTQDNRWQIPVDYIKGYAMMSLLLELNGGGTTGRFAKDEMPRITAHLTPEQIEEAKKIAAEWKSTHPPLSFFPDKLSP